MYNTTIPSDTIPTVGFNPCIDESMCRKLEEPPLLVHGASVYVVFGINDINRDAAAVQHDRNEKVLICL